MTQRIPYSSIFMSAFFLSFSFLRSGDRPDLCKITSCFADWRCQEDEWPALKKREMGGVSHGQNLSENDTNHDNENDACEVEMALRGMSVTPAALVPSDCILVREVSILLKSGYGDFDNILLPSDTPPGKYVIEVSDGVSVDCIRTPTSDFISTDSVGLLSPVSQLPTGPVALRNKATLEEMKGLFPVVQPIRVNRQIIFHAVSALQPVTS